VLCTKPRHCPPSRARLRPPGGATRRGYPAIKPTEPLGVSAPKRFGLPHSLLERVVALEQSEAMRQALGDGFVTAYSAIKRAEFETFMHVISPWEREFLLPNV